MRDSHPVRLAVLRTGMIGSTRRERGEFFDAIFEFFDFLLELLGLFVVFVTGSESVFESLEARFFLSRFELIKTPRGREQQSKLSSLSERDGVMNSQRLRPESPV